MAEAEERAHRHGPLARRDEPARHEVDGGDVVGVEGVAEAERVGERAGGDEVGVRQGQDEGAHQPDYEVDQDEEQDDEQGAEREGAEIGCAGVEGGEGSDGAQVFGSEA